MIDLENEKVKGLIEDIKRILELEILKCFECKVNVLNVGEPKGGSYLINICFMGKENEYNLPLDFCITTNIEIFEEDYNKKYYLEIKNVSD